MIQETAFEFIKIINEEESKYSNVSEIFKEDEFYNLKKRLTSKVNALLNPKKFDRWQLRELVNTLFETASIDLEVDSIRKIIFLLITDIINERLPSPSPLYFSYEGYLIPKRHAIITDFELFPFLKEEADKLYSQKKHLLVFKIFSDGEIIKEGVSYYLNVIDYLLFLLLDKALYEEIIPVDKILEEKSNVLQVNQKNLSILLNFLFLAAYEFFSEEKQNLKNLIFSNDLIKSFIKSKKLVKEMFSENKEKNFLIKLAIEDEKLSENRKNYISQKEVQENIISEAKKREVPEIDKIDAVVWLIGLNNLDENVFFENFKLKDFIDFINLVENDIEEDKQSYKNGLKSFLKKVLNNFELTNIDFTILENLIKSEFEDLYKDFLFKAGKYEEFLKISDKENINDEIKILFSRYKTGEIEKKEFENWISLYENKENINFSLLNFVKNG
jgi:hypothetical protein